jgi:hypothetical protein
MAAHIDDPQDRKALELHANAWEKVANEREAALQKMSRQNSHSRSTAATLFDRVC